MKSAVVETVGGATITKLVVRGSVTERSSSTGTKLGRRHFSHTVYFVKREGRSPVQCATLAIAREEASK